MEPVDGPAPVLERFANGDVNVDENALLGAVAVNGPGRGRAAKDGTTPKTEVAPFDPFDENPVGACGTCTSTGTGNERDENAD